MRSPAALPLRARIRTYTATPFALRDRGQDVLVSVPLLLLTQAGITLDVETSGALASTPSANSHRERWRELALRNRGNRRRAVQAARCQVQQEEARAFSWEMWGEPDGLFYGAGCA